MIDGWVVPTAKARETARELSTSTKGETIEGRKKVERFFLLKCLSNSQREDSRRGYFVGSPPDLINVFLAYRYLIYTVGLF